MDVGHAQSGRRCCSCVLVKSVRSVGDCHSLARSNGGSLCCGERKGRTVGVKRLGVPCDGARSNQQHALSGQETDYAQRTMFNRWRCDTCFASVIIHSRTYVHSRDGQRLKVSRWLVGWWVGCGVSRRRNTTPSVSRTRVVSAKVRKQRSLCVCFVRLCLCFPLKQPSNVRTSVRTYLPACLPTDLPTNLSYLHSLHTT